MGALSLATDQVVIRRTVHLGTDGTAYVAAWIPVREAASGDDGEKRYTAPIILTRTTTGTITAYGPTAHLFAGCGETAPRLPEGVAAELDRNPPPTSADNMAMSVDAVQRLLRGERPDLARLYDDLRAMFLRFAAFPTTGEATPDDYAAFLACYVISTFLLPAFNAVGYVWLTGIKGSGKSTVATIIARTACLPLMASASSTLASLRGHADAGGTLALDNFETVKNKDDNARYLLSACELGYMSGAVQTYQVPNGAGKGWKTERASVYANRVFTAVATPPDALASRCVVILMYRTADTTKANYAPGDDENWTLSPHAFIQHGWMVALHHLAEAATTVRTITSTNTGLTNRTLQVWRPALTVAKMVDAKNSDTAAWDCLLRLAHALLNQGAEDDDAREVLVVRALIAIAADGDTSTTTAATLTMLRTQYYEEHGEPSITDAGKDALAPLGLESAKKLGTLFKRMNVPKLQRQNTGNVYDVSPATLARLITVYLPAQTTTVPQQTTRPAHTAQTARSENEESVDRDPSAGGVVLWSTATEHDETALDWAGDALFDAGNEEARAEHLAYQLLIEHPGTSRAALLRLVMERGSIARIIAERAVAALFMENDEVASDD